MFACLVEPGDSAFTEHSVCHFCSNINSGEIQLRNGTLDGLRRCCGLIRSRSIRNRRCGSFEHGFDDYFILAMELDPAGLRFQPEEVQAARWAEREEIHEMIDRGVFIPYWHELIDLLFASRFHWGAHQPHN